MPGSDRLKPKLASALSPPVEMVQNPAPGMEQLKPLPPPIVKNQGPMSQVKDTKPHATSDLVNSKSPMSQVSPNRWNQTVQIANASITLPTVGRII